MRGLWTNTNLEGKDFVVVVVFRGKRNEGSAEDRNGRNFNFWTYTSLIFLRIVVWLRKDKT